MRDCIFLVADNNMEEAFKGFLCRDQFNLSLQCGSFAFDPKQDVIVASGDNDPGLYTRGHEILRPFLKTHAHSVVVVDAAWEGSPGAETITAHITENLYRSGWTEEHCKVIVIDPELENWIWQRNDHVARALGLGTAANLGKHISAEVWPKGQAKPIQPKETLESILQINRIPRSSAIYKRITEKVSVGSCVEPSFQLLRRTLQDWFPNE